MIFSKSRQHYVLPCFNLYEHFEWVDAQLSGVNWKAIGPAKRRLSHDQSIRTSKMMHLWLSIGKQKARIMRRQLMLRAHAADTS